MSKYLVLDNGRILVDKDIFYGKRRDLGEEYAAKGVGYRGINASKRELCVEGTMAMEGDVEVLENVS